MSERAAEYFPYVLAVLLPPVGLLLAAVARRDDPAEAIRLTIVSVLAIVIWVLLYTS